MIVVVFVVIVFAASLYRLIVVGVVDSLALRERRGGGDSISLGQLRNVKTVGGHVRMITRRIQYTTKQL